MLALTKSTTVVPKTDLGQTVVAPENETALANRATPDEFQDFKESSNAIVTAAQIERQKAQAAAVDAAASPNGLSWKQLGPYNIGGRVTDVVADRFTPNAAFAAVSGGGIWKTTDGGANWASSGPTRTSQTMGAFAQAPNGDLWAGTGEANPPGGGLTYFGDGIYKSTDNGTTWSKMGLADERGDRPHRGRSVRLDSGSSSPPPATSPARLGPRPVPHAGRRQDVGARARPARRDDRRDRRRRQPREPATIVYASLWDHKRTTARASTAASAPACSAPRTAATRGSGCRTSSTRCRPTTDADRPEGRREPRPHRHRDRAEQPEPHLRRLRLAVRARQGLLLLRRRRRHAARRRPRVRVQAASSGGSGSIWVDPEDQEPVFNADVNLRRRRRRPDVDHVGGAARRPARMDWDRSTLDGDPATPRRVFLGNDGGMYRSETNGAPGSWVKSANQPWNQLYHLAISQQDSHASADRPAGQRHQQELDADLPRRRADPQLRDWNSSGGGDGHYNVIDPIDDRVYYTCSQSSGGGSHSCAGRRDTATATQNFTVDQQRLPGRSALHDRRAAGDRPERPAAGADGTQPPNALYVGGSDHRTLAQPGRRHDRSQPRSYTLPRTDPTTRPDAACPGGCPLRRASTSGSTRTCTAR